MGGSDEGPGEVGGLSCRAPRGHHMAPHGITGTALHHRCHAAARGWVLDKTCNKGGDKKKKQNERSGGRGGGRGGSGGSSRDSLLNLSALHYRWKIQRKKKRKKKSVAELFKTLKPVLFK